MSEHLNSSGIAVVELIEAPEEGIVGNQVIARINKAIGSNITNGTAGKLRMVEEVDNLRADVERISLAEAKPLLDAEIDVIGRLEREGIPPAVGQCAGAGDDVTGIRIVGHIGHDGPT